MKTVIGKNSIFLISLWLFHLLNNFLWLMLDKYPLLWDAGNYYFESLILSDYLKHFPSLPILKIFKVGLQYPPFVPFITAIFYIFFGKSDDIAVLASSSLFLAILIFSIYGITKNIYNKKTGLLAAFLVTMYPIVFAHSRTYLYDLPVTAAVCLGVYLFQKTNNFASRRYSLCLGIAVGFGLLIKFSFILFFVSAILYISYKDFLNSYISNPRGYFRQKINFLIVVLTAMLIAATWYIPNFLRFLHAVTITPGICRSVSPATFSFQSVFYYFFRLINYQISFFMFLVFVLGFFYFKRLKLKDGAILLHWLLVSYLACILVNYKSPRYTLPYLPAIAIISAIGLMNIQPQKVRRATIVLVISLSLLQFFVYSFGVKFLPKIIKIDLPVKLKLMPGLNSIIIFDQVGNENRLEQHGKIRPEDWRTEEVLDLLASSSIDIKGRSINIFLIPDDPRVHSPLVYSAFKRKIHILLSVASADNIASTARDYVIVKDSKWLSPPYFNEKIQQSLSTFEKNKQDYVLIKKIILPDNSGLLIYKKRMNSDIKASQC